MKRTALERINDQPDQGFRPDRHYIRGIDRIETRLSLSVAVMMALTVDSFGRKRPELMRSLVKEVPLHDTGRPPTIPFRWIAFASKPLRCRSPRILLANQSRLQYE